MKHNYALLLLLASSFSALACTCEKLPPVTTAVANASQVFTGIPVIVASVPLGTNSAILATGHTFRVLRSWKGATNEYIEVLSPGVCDFEFHLNVPHLVYTFEMYGEVFTSMCTRTAPLTRVSRKEFELLGAPIWQAPADNEGKNRLILPNNAIEPTMVRGTANAGE